MDWKKIKKEYIKGGISQRKLAEKHGISYGTLRKVAEKENWTELRAKAGEKAGAEMARNVGKSMGRAQSKVFEVAELLLNKLAGSAEAMDTIDPDSIRKLTGALKDLRDIIGAKSGADLREQEARIAKLEAEVEAARAEGDAPEISVELMEAEEYAE